VAFSGPLNLAPWLYVIPIDLAPFKQFLVHVGVCPEFTVSQYRSLLADMAEAVAGKPLAPGQLVQVLRLPPARVSVLLASWLLLPSSNNCRRSWL
jgi:hypothetical protein